MTEPDYSDRLVRAVRDTARAHRTKAIDLWDVPVEDFPAWLELIGVET